MRPESDIDPRKLDVEPRRRRRKDRGKPDPKPNLKAGKEDATARAMARPLSPGVMLEPRGDGWQATSPHSDGDLWELQLADAFGTRSHSVIRAFVHDLRKLCPEAWDEDLRRWKANETDLNAALAMVADWQPENTAQAALAAQLVALHWMVMRLSSQALNRGHMIMEREAAIAGKLSRTYAQLCETMQSLKGQKRTASQSISVKRESHHHQHIHVHRDGGDAKNVGQPHEARAAPIEERTSLPGPIEGNGAVVPFPGGEGQDRMQQARRGRGSP
jgi:hypothetical protein